MQADSIQLPLEFIRKGPSSLAELLPSVTELQARASNVCKTFSDLEPTLIFFEYWRFACERQRIFFKRLSGQQAPWTVDEILREYKFTNVYRILDRTSQFLVRDVQGLSLNKWSRNNLFFRTMLFKFFNRISTWRLLVSELGEEPTCENFSSKRYGQILERTQAKGGRLYSAAYIMPSGGRGTKFHRKYELHLWLLDRMIKDCLSERLAQSTSMEEGFSLLRSYQTIGDFLAYQYVTDLNYSHLTDYSESSFVVPGPGARDGLRKCFGRLDRGSEAAVIIRMAAAQKAVFYELGLNFQNLGIRPLQYIDCQNVLCEVDKYSRVAHPQFSGNTGRMRIKQHFTAEKESFTFVLPIKSGWPNAATIISSCH